MPCVYRHIRLDKNQPFYVGIGNTAKRPYHKGSRRTKHWNNVVNKTDYEVEILFDGITWEQAQSKEIEFIKLYGRRNNNTGSLVNLTDGGQGVLNRILGEEGRRKISEAQKRIGSNPEERKRRSERMKGENNPYYGKPSPMKGKINSPEHIAKRKATLILNPQIAWNKGIPRTDEEKKAQSLKISGRIYIVISEENEANILELINKKVSLRKIEKITGVKKHIITRFIKKGK